MSKSTDNPIWVRWYASNAYSGTFNLTAIEECAYRRILDMIFMSDDCLRDDDRVMPAATKACRQWKSVKRRLIDLGKIEVSDGFIRNARATQTCFETRTFRAQKVAAAVASHGAGKRMKNNDTGSADAPLPQPLPHLREGMPVNSYQVSKEESSLRSAADVASSGAEVGEVTQSARAELLLVEAAVADRTAPTQPGLFGEPHAEPKRATPRAAVFAEGLNKISEMTGKPTQKHRSWLAGLFNEFGDWSAVVLLETIQDAHRMWLDPDTELAEPISWVTKTFKARAGGSKPALVSSKPDEVRKVPEQVGPFKVSGIIEECNSITNCHGEGCWPGFDLMIADALASGADPDNHILPVMKEIKRRGNWRDISSVRFFIAAIKNRREGVAA